MSFALPSTDQLLARLSARVPGMMYAFVREADGRMHMPYVSDAVRTLYGLGPDTVRHDARQLLRCVHPDDLPLLAERTRRSRTTGAPWNAVFRVLLPDGRLRWHQGHSQVERRPDGSVVWYGYIDDATEQMNQRDLAQRHQRLQQAHQGLAGSLQRLAHELATPLCGVIGLVQLLLRHGELLALGIRQQLERVLGAGRHMQQLVRDLGDLGALEGGRLPFQTAPLDLAEATREACELMAAVAGERQVVVSTSGTDAPWVRADALRLRQVLLNLLGNALKFTPAGGRVTLRLSTGAERARLEVQDTGPGMDAEQQAKLFVPYARLGAEQRGIEGSGLGLALSRGLVEAMGGHIGVRSAPGQGTCITLELPLAAFNPDGAAPAAAARPTLA